MLGLLLDDDEELLARVDVTTVDAYANGVVRASSTGVPKLIGDRDQRQLWAKVVKQLDLPFTGRFMAQEYRHVVLGQDIRETTYLRVCVRAARLIADGPTPYAHVVEDEAQDQHPAQWRVLRAAVQPGPDDLFVTGDPHQRIYDARVSLGSPGTATAGRSFRLRVNYRSTENVLAWPAGLLAPVAVEALVADVQALPAEGLAARWRDPVRLLCPQRVRGLRSRERRDPVGRRPPRRGTREGWSGAREQGFHGLPWPSGPSRDASGRPRSA